MTRFIKISCLLIATSAFLFLAPLAYAEIAQNQEARDKAMDLMLAQLDRMDAERRQARPVKKVSPEKKPKKVKIGGYYKNLATASKTTSTKEHFFSDTQRLRLETNAELNDNLSLLFIYDNELLINDFANTSDFDLIRQKEQKKLSFLDTDKTLSDRSHVYWKHSLYRLYLKYTSPDLHFIVGKQAIDWSRMRLYHPLDLFNRISPLDLEKDEKIGVDALNLELYPDQIACVNLIYVPYKNSERNGFGIRTYRKVQDYDLSFIVAEYKKDKVLGFGFDGYIKEAGFRGELTTTKKDNHKEFVRTNIGLDHSFSPKLYTVAEYFYNGGAEKDSEQFLNSYEFSRQAMTMRKHILGMGAEYELTGIAKLANYLFYDFEKEGVFYNPELRYNIISNLDLNLGAQFFWGNKSSEFGNYENLYYTQLKLFF